MGNMQETGGNISKQMVTLRKNQKKILEIRDSVTEMNNAFHGLMKILNMAEKRICVLEVMSIGTSKTEMQKEKRIKTEYHRTVGQFF